ncbi:MAG: DUF2793 domain-containing protein [Erythrobacter sp.]
MATPVTFPSSTPRFSLPLLFAGQAQKEFFLNQSFSLVDALLQIAVEQTSTSPPNDSSDGLCYLVKAPAEDAWTGHEDEIAVRLGGGWQFVAPQQGMTIYDRQDGALSHFDTGWLKAVEPNLPTTGATIDTEARLMLSELVEALRTLGIFANLE